MKVWWILFYHLSLYIYNRQIYISAQYFKQFFVGKGIKSGTHAPPTRGGNDERLGGLNCIWLLLRGELRKLLPYHSILPLRSIWSIQILFSHAFSIECIWLIQLWWGVWWDMGPTRGSGCAHRGRDPFPKHNHSSVSLFGYFSFWLLQCPITRHRTKQQIKTRSLGTGCGDIFWGGGQLIEKNLDDET